MAALHLRIRISFIGLTESSTVMIGRLQGKLLASLGRQRLPYESESPDA